jgi:chitodextrinase
MKSHIHPLLASLLVAASACLTSPAHAQGTIIDHNCTNIAAIPEAAITQAKQNLQIAYGHTSHGSQITDGMSGLVAFMNNRGYPNNLYSFNNTGSGGALRLYDTPFAGAYDLGNPNRTAWATATRSYLGSPNAQGRGNTRPDINVIMWSWCGQADGSPDEIQLYLNQMHALESEYPGVRFVYMTGHLVGTGGAGNLNQRNNQIRAYCRTNNKTLFDFADIESYDPDGLVNYMERFATEDCNYDSNGDNWPDRNWAIDWQNSHTEGVDWYYCGAAHSQPLNANRKAYAAWYLWARIAGWQPVADSTPPSIPAGLHTTTILYNRVELAWNASADPESGVSGYRIYRGGSLLGYTSTTNYADSTVNASTIYSYTVCAVNGAALASSQCSPISATTPAVTDTQPPTVPGSLQVSAATTSAITITWSPSSDNVGVSGYRIFRNAVEVGTAPGTTFTDTGLAPGTTYTYRVSARDAAGNESALSASLSAQTSDTADTQPPSVPTGLQVGAITSSSLQLTWTPSSDNRGVAGYHIFRGTQNLGTATGTSFSDSGLAASTNYTYRVTAFDATGNESAQSAPITARTLDPSQATHTIDISGPSAVDDAFISASAPNTNEGGTAYVGTIDRFVIKFQLPPAVVGRRIISANVRFYVWNQTNYQPNQYLELYRMTRDWAESSVTWNNAASGTSWSTAGGDYAENVGRILQLPDRAAWDHAYYPAVDITTLVQKWAAGTVPNWGIMMVHSPLTGIGLKACEYSAGPVLHIVYSDEPAPALYEMWMHSAFTNAELANPGLETTLWGRNADPDGDGIINLFEYALGSDAKTAEQILAKTLNCTQAEDGSISLKFRRRPHTLGVGYGLVSSQDLATWIPVPSASIQETVIDCGCGLEEVLWKVAPAAGSQRCFYRLQLSAQ